MDCPSSLPNAGTADRALSGPPASGCVADAQLNLAVKAPAAEPGRQTRPAHEIRFKRDLPARN
jgi:hypothetical protein